MSAFDDDDDFFADIYAGSASKQESNPAPEVKPEPASEPAAPASEQTSNQNVNQDANQGIKQEEAFAQSEPSDQSSNFGNPSASANFSGATASLSNENQNAIDALMRAGNQGGNQGGLQSGNMNNFNNNNNNGNMNMNMNMNANNNQGFSQQGQEDVRRDGSATNTGQIYIPPKDEGKMFVGGLNWETTDESLRNYFSKFGELIDCTVMRDNTTGRSRGFGFLTFADAKCVNAVIATDHFLDGRIIDPKRAIPREEQDKTAKIFVGGVGLDVSEEDFNQFFSRYGTVIDAQLMIDTKTGKPRGFGFITFDSHEAVERIVNEPVLILKDKAIEVKRAEPRLKDANGNYISNSTSNNNSNNQNNNNQHNNNQHNSSHHHGGNQQMNNRFNNAYGGYMGYNMGNGMNMMGGMGMNQMGMNQMGMNQMNQMNQMGSNGNNESQGSANGPNGPNGMPNMQSMNPAMMMQYYSTWMQYFNQSEQMIMRQGNGNPASAQQLQQVHNMRDMFLANMKNMGFDPKNIGSNSGSTSNSNSSNGDASNGNGQEGSNQNTADPRDKKADFNKENQQNNEISGLRTQPRSFDNKNTNFHNNNFHNKSSAAITLVQENDQDQGNGDNNDQDKNDRDSRNDRDNRSDRDRTPRESNKRHRGKYDDDDDENDNDDFDTDRSYHRSSRNDKSHKSGREMSLGDRIREGNSDRKRRRGDDDKDVSGNRHNSHHHHRDRDHKSSRQGGKSSSGGSNRGGNKRSKDDNRRDRDSKDRQSKSPPLNAPTGPRGGSSSGSFRNGGGGKNYSRRYRSGK